MSRDGAATDRSVGCGRGWGIDRIGRSAGSATITIGGTVWVPIRGGIGVVGTRVGTGAGPLGGRTRSTGAFTRSTGATPSSGGGTAWRASSRLKQRWTPATAREYPRTTYQSICSHSE